MFILLLICTILLACIVFPDLMGWLFAGAVGLVVIAFWIGVLGAVVAVGFLVFS